MRSQRYPCARAGVFLLAVVFAIAVPTFAQARGSFNSGVTGAIDQIVNLIAQDGAGNAPRSEMRHLRQALNQLLDVLERHHQMHHHHGHMGKGMFAHHHHHHGMSKQQGGNVGAGAGKKQAAHNVGPTAKGLTIAKKGVGNAPGKRATASAKGGNLGQFGCNVKQSNGPRAASVKNGGKVAVANRKSAGNTQFAGNAKNGVSHQTGNRVGGRVGNNKNQQAACHVKNTQGIQGAKTMNNAASFGHAKSGYPGAGKAGVAVGSSPLAAHAVRQVAGSKTPTPMPGHNVAKGNAGVNQKSAAFKVATPVAAKKTNAAAHPAAHLAMHQTHAAHNPISAMMTAHSHAGASVGHHTAAHPSPIRRR